MSKFCIKCGNRCVDQAEHCPRCGTAFGVNPVSPPPTPIQPMSHPQHSQSALLGKVQMFWNRLQSDRQFLKKVIIATVTVVICLVAVLVFIQRMNSIDGTWVSSADGSQKLIIRGNIIEGYYQGKTRDIYEWELDKKQHMINISWDGEKERIWYRKKGNTLYMYDTRLDYEDDKPDLIFYRE